MSRIIGDTTLINRMAEITGKSLPSFSLPAPSDTLLQPVVITTKAQTQAQVFSSSSYLNTEIKVDNNRVSTNQTPITDSWQVSLFLMLILGYYLFVLYRYMPLFSTVFRVGFSIKKTLTLYEIQNNEQSALVAHCRVLTVMLISMAGYNMIPIQSQMQPFAMIGAIVGAVFVMQFYKWTVLKICDAMSESGEAFIFLSQIRSQTFILVSIIGIPVAVVASIYPGDNYGIMFSLILLWLYAIIRILMLFINCGFGVLRWILYLCAVELLPISYIVAIAQRL